MAQRFYLPFYSLPNEAGTGEQWRAEIWDSDFVGTATEFNGNFEGMRIEWEGEEDVPGPMMLSSCTLRFLIEEEADMAIITALAGAAEGRFKLVVKRGGSSEVYWAGWVHADDCSYPDSYYPFHFTIYATDGIARLKDIDYTDSLGDFFLGEETVLEHLVRIVDKIGVTDVGTWPTNRFRSTANWFSNGMNTTTCPLHQALVNHDRFVQLDREGNETPWSCYAVLEALLRPFNVQLMHEGGMYHLRQLGLYKEATQKEYYYDDAGAHLSTTATANLDRTVDYATPGGMRKVAVGVFDFLPALKEVCVDYHHMTSNDKAQGQSWSTGDEAWTTLPGSVIVDAADTTYLRSKIRIRHKSNVVVIPPGSAPYPDHRLRFSIQIRMEDSTTPGSYYYLQRTTNTNVPFYDLQPSEMEWFFEGPDNFKIWAQPINDFDNGLEYELLVAFTSPTLPEEVSGSKIEMKIDLLGAELTNGGDLVIDGINYQGGISWYTNGVSLTVEEEGNGEAASSDIERYCSAVTGDNTQKRIIDTYLGDGPAPFSLSAFHVGTAATTAWKINNTGTGVELPTLLAEQVLRFRKTPQPVFRGTFLHKSIRPYERFVDDDKAWMAVRIALSAFENKWEGDFVVMDKDVDGIVNEPPTPYPGPLPPTLPPDYPLPPQTPPIVKEDGFAGGLPPFNGIAGGTIPGYVGMSEQSPTTLTADLLASAFNSSHELPVAASDFAWVKKGDQVTVVNPITQYRETFTVATDYVPGDTVLDIKTSESMVKDFPFGSFVKLAPGQQRGPSWSYYELNVTGTGTSNEFWEVPTAVGTLPSPSVFSAAAIRERVEVVMGGTRLVYDANPYAHAFGIKPSTNEIEVYVGIVDVPMLVIVR